MPATIGLVSPSLRTGAVENDRKKAAHEAAFFVRADRGRRSGTLAKCRTSGGGGPMRAIAFS
jgi:hypothetical protein